MVKQGIHPAHERRQVKQRNPEQYLLVAAGTTNGGLLAKEDSEQRLSLPATTQAANQVIQDFIDSRKFKNTECITRYVSENLHPLRKIASILKAGDYKQTDYIAQMIMVSKSED